MKKLPGKEISCIYDQFGPVRVFDDGNKRYLSFGAGDEQSCMIKATPSVLQHDYNRAMALVLLFCQPQQVTILGLGGGCLPTCLLTHLADVQLTVVELRKAVIDTALQYFFLTPDRRLNIVHDNALDHLAQMPTGGCELLFSDLFIAEGLEARQLTRQFINDAWRCLSDEGWLVINCLEEYRTRQVLEGLLGEVFAALFECVTDDGNWVIIAAKNAQKMSRPVLLAEAKQWSQRLGFSLLPHLKRLTRY